MSATIIPPYPYESPESTTSTSSGISISTILWWIVLIMTVVYVIVSQEQQRKRIKKSSEENDTVGLLILPVPIPIMPEENPRFQAQARRVSDRVYFAYCIRKLTGSVQQIGYYDSTVSSSYRGGGGGQGRRNRKKRK
ncbi:hypothetical protein WG66_003941 [Moniliophthora roreri]|nr:hypothetical protein WG66_003941 [Moniliophthora roreri]